MEFFRRIFKSRSFGGPDILNAGLQYAMEFGENFMQPIQQRFSAKFPQLNADELNDYDDTCRKAMKAGHSLVYDYLTILSKRNEKITTKQLSGKLNEFMKSRYSWINESNLSTLHNQGMYYAWKDGMDGCVV